MEEFKGTPGPWVVKGDEDYFSIFSDAECICSSIIFDHEDVEEAKCNGNLIAAAPDLLEALQEMIRQFPSEIYGSKNEDFQSRAIDSAKIAIEKALK